jgi:fumarate reductase flavoprotein subunit
VTVTVAGAGMAGLVAAARLQELGSRPVVCERGTRAGGSMLLSSGVVWRHRDWEAFRAECPGGDERLQRLVWERLDEAIAWLESLGAEPVWQETGNPRTVGKRFDPAALTTLLAERAGDVRLGVDGCADGPVILATGGFAASRPLVAEHIAPAAPLQLRANPWSVGDGLAYATARGAALSSGLDEFYGRNMPDAEWGEREFVSLSQLYARYARIFDEDGVEFFTSADVTWSETNVVQATARRPGARAYYVVDDAALGERVRDRSVADLVAAAPAEARLQPEELPFEAPAGSIVAVRVLASITHTIGGLRVDEQARVLDVRSVPLDGVWAAGVDAGGVATGGYTSGLAQALVLGLAAAESYSRPTE